MYLNTTTIQLLPEKISSFWDGSIKIYGVSKLGLHTKPTFFFWISTDQVIKFNRGILSFMFVSYRAVIEE